MMTYFNARIVAALALSGIVMHGEASAQAGKDKLAGTTWTLTSITYNQDGKTRDIFGEKPTGALMFDTSGHFVQI